MKGIVWLTSYPKSGNTWVRVFLANLRRNAQTPVDIDELGDGFIASHRKLIDNVIGFESSDLSPEQIERLRPAVYEYLATETEGPLFIKIHDAYTYTSEGQPLVPAGATLGVIYIVRNPMDTAVSWAHYYRRNLDKVIEQMGDEQYALVAKTDRLRDQVRQRLLSWSGHVQSWLEARDLRVHLVRYEDMQRQPQETFTGIARYAGLTGDPERVARAIAHSGFRVVQEQESQHGFRERLPQAASFFRQAQVGAWRQVFTQTQVEALIKAHSAVMQRLGYISAEGKPVY